MYSLVLSGDATGFLVVSYEPIATAKKKKGAHIMKLILHPLYTTNYSLSTRIVWKKLSKTRECQT